MQKPHAELDIGVPVQWMVDPVRPDLCIGVVYEFGLTGERKTVWYTPNRRQPKVFSVVVECPES